MALPTINKIIPVSIALPVVTQNDRDIMKTLVQESSFVNLKDQDDIKRREAKVLLNKENRQATFIQIHGNFIKKEISKPDKEIQPENTNLTSNLIIKTEVPEPVEEIPPENTDLMLNSTTKESEQTLICEYPKICNATFSTTSNLYLHMQSHGIFICSYSGCKSRFIKQGDYFEHVRYGHSRLDRLHQILESKSVFLIWDNLCLICNEVSINNDFDHSRHFYCQFCTYYTCQKKILNEHLWNKHGYCSRCKSTPSSNNILDKNHDKLHHFECPAGNCDVQNTDEKMILSHVIDTHHIGSAYKTFCMYKNSTQTISYTCLRYKSKEPFLNDAKSNCLICGMDYNEHYKGDLNLHVEHYGCKKCDVYSIDPKMIETHMVEKHFQNQKVVVIPEKITETSIKCLECHEFDTIDTSDFINHFNEKHKDINCTFCKDLCKATKRNQKNSSSDMSYWKNHLLDGHSTFHQPIEPVQPRFQLFHENLVSKVPTKKNDFLSVWKCKECNHSIKDSKDFMDHFSKQHRIKCSKICYLCFAYFSASNQNIISKDIWKNHLIAVHSTGFFKQSLNNFGVNQEIGTSFHSMNKIPCKICMLFFSKTGIKHHYIIAHKYCRKCDMSFDSNHLEKFNFKNERLIFDHLFNVHGLQCKCELCPYIDISKRGMSYHIALIHQPLVHAKKLPYHHPIVNYENKNSYNSDAFEIIRMILDNVLESIGKDVSEDENDIIPLSMWKKKRKRKRSAEKNQKICDNLNKTAKCTQVKYENIVSDEEEMLSLAKKKKLKTKHNHTRSHIEMENQKEKKGQSLDLTLSGTKSLEKKTCVVPGCQIKDFTGFFEFPIDLVAKKLWKNVCGLQEVGLNDQICYSHFKPSVFSLWPFRLNPSAVPELNLPIVKLDK